jgi:biopolymer transport protein ExbD
MAFQRYESHRSQELISLVDIVFLLLLFFLVTFSFTLAGDVSDAKIYSEVDLPKTATELPVIKDDVLQNLMIQIIPDSSGGAASRLAFVLWPSFEDTLQMTRMQAFRRAILDSTFESFPQDFLLMPAAEFNRSAPCTLISNSIARFIEKEKFYHNNSHPIVEVRADRNTEFRIINFIMNTCSDQPRAIPQIVLRTTL